MGESYNQRERKKPNNLRIYKIHFRQETESGLGFHTKSEKNTNNSNNSRLGSGFIFMWRLQ